MRGDKYSREETMLAFELYCTIPKGQDTIHNPKIIALAKAIGRPVNSIKLKLQNFKSYDPSYIQDGRVGMVHGSRLDKEICDEFFQNWDSLIVETSEIRKSKGLPQIEETIEEIQNIPVGITKTTTAKQRIGQSFFRQALLAAYDNRCCFTGIAIPELLRASHIKPWSKSNDVNEKTNPQNGLLLNALHDAAFDKGYITITFDYRIVVSRILLSENVVSAKYFAPLNGEKMALPSRFLPDRQFIEYHNDIFQIMNGVGSVNR
jgi:putative restriction endonuclease